MVYSILWYYSTVMANAILVKELHFGFMLTVLDVMDYLRIVLILYYCTVGDTNTSI
jgi:hypothetical protein